MISVVIPVFRGRDRLRTALESVRAQTLVYVALAAKRGTSAARNAALERSRGDLVAFLDADDEWTPAHLATVTACLGGGHALAVSAVETWDEFAGRSVAVHGMDPAWLAAPRDALFVASIIHTASCVVMPRATVDRIGLFDTAMPVGQDRDYWFRAVDAGGTLGYSAACTTRYVRHAASSTRDRRAVLASVIGFHAKHRLAAGVSDEARRRARALVLAARSELDAAEPFGSP